MIRLANVTYASMTNPIRVRMRAPYCSRLNACSMWTRSMIVPLIQRNKVVVCHYLVDTIVMPWIDRRLNVWQRILVKGSTGWLGLVLGQATARDFHRDTKYGVLARPPIDLSAVVPDEYAVWVYCLDEV